MASEIVDLEHGLVAATAEKGNYHAADLAQFYKRRYVFEVEMNKWKYNLRIFLGMSSRAYVNTID